MHFTAFVLLMDSFLHAIKKKCCSSLDPGQATAKSLPRKITVTVPNLTTRCLMGAAMYDL